MSERKARRGRPKGSEIDDSGQLRAIAKLISEDPELKPTTAIRSMGISDPSTIRRLRDKYNERREQLEARIAASKPAPASSETPDNKSAAPSTNRTAFKPQNAQSEARTIALDLPNWDVITEAINKGALNGATPRQQKTDRSQQRQPKPQRKSAVYVEPAMRGCGPISPGTVAVAWWSVGMKSWATMAGINLALCQKFAKLPVAQSAVRQQVELNNLMLDALFGTGKPKKFH